MRRAASRWTLSRRRFAFWIGFGLFQLAERLQVQAFDSLAAAAMGETVDPLPQSRWIPTHWRAASNRTWRWFEREQLIRDEWVLTGITTPVRKSTGEPLAGGRGYLDDREVPLAIRGVTHVVRREPIPDDSADDSPPGVASQTRRNRHGRPPSRWLRSLRADELRIWLKTIDVPEAGVEGMTFWTHLTRDHFFEPDKIAGLTEEEQALLHAAAHHGY